MIITSMSMRRRTCGNWGRSSLGLGGWSEGVRGGGGVEYGLCGWYAVYEGQSVCCREGWAAIYEVVVY